MKIALLTDGLFPDSIGGIQKHSHLLIKYLSKNNIYVDVFYTKNNLGNSSLSLKDYNLKYLNFFEFKMPSTFYFPGSYVYNSYRLSKLFYQNIKLNSYNFIYAQGFTSWYLLKKQPRKRNLISNLHGLNAYQVAANKVEALKQILLKIPSNTIIKLSKHHISLGGELESILLKKGVKSDSIFTIPNAVESSWVIKKLSNTISDKLKFIFIGRYDRVKGLDKIFKVINKLINKYDFEFHFIGEIPKDKRIYNDNFFFHGIINNPEIIKKTLIDSDILVCPSYSEGMPTVILEAMACGCAIIATDVGAVKTMVNDENGWLINNINLEEELEKAIISSILEKKTLFNKKLNSLNIVKKEFTWDNIINKTIDMMEALSIKKS